MLEVQDLVVRYGAATALDGVSLRVERGEMVALIGPNGAGKSTLLNTICGLLRAGERRPIAWHGRVAQVPEGRQLFAEHDASTTTCGWARGRFATATRSECTRCFRRCVGVARRVAGTLSGGEQQMVAVGRALMAQPDLLAVDELSLGLAPMVVDDLADHLVRLNRDSGMAVLLVEQNARLALELCPRAYVLEAGRIALSGTSPELPTARPSRRPISAAALDEVG